MTMKEEEDPKNEGKCLNMLSKHAYVQLYY